jgi:hypothetical protein
MPNFTEAREDALEAALASIPENVKRLDGETDIVYALRGMFASGWSAAVTSLEGDISSVEDDESIISSAIKRAERITVREPSF